MKNLDFTSLYYEAHITIEPLFGERLKQLSLICHEHGFRVADLLMKKRASDKAERSKYDTFCTGRASEYKQLLDRMLSLIEHLQSKGFKVWRYKIEIAIIDSKIDDVLFRLN